MDIISWIKTTLSKYSSNNTHDKNAIYFVKNEDGKTGKIISDEVVYGNGDDANGVVVESPNQPTGGESVWVNPDEDPEEVEVYNRSQVDALHQSIVNSITSLSEAGYLFSGVATSKTDPGTPDAKVFYIANGKGTYEKFGGLEVTEDEVVILYYDSSWHKVSTGIASLDRLITIADEEDITRNVDGKLQFKDRAYGDGMGYVILRKDKTFAEQVTNENTIYEIRYDFDLKGESLHLPANIVLWFLGGSVNNGVISFEGEAKVYNGYFYDCTLIARSDFLIENSKIVIENIINMRHVCILTEGLVNDCNCTIKNNTLVSKLSISGNYSDVIKIIADNHNVNFNITGNYISGENCYGVESQGASFETSGIFANNIVIAKSLGVSLVPAKESNIVIDGNYVSADITGIELVDGSILSNNIITMSVASANAIQVSGNSTTTNRPINISGNKITKGQINIINTNRSFFIENNDLFGTLLLDGRVSSLGEIFVVGNRIECDPDNLTFRGFAVYTSYGGNITIKGNSLYLSSGPTISGKGLIVITNNKFTIDSGYSGIVFNLAKNVILTNNEFVLKNWTTYYNQDYSLVFLVMNQDRLNALAPLSYIIKDNIIKAENLDVVVAANKLIKIVKQDGTPDITIYAYIHNNTILNYNEIERGTTAQRPVITLWDSDFEYFDTDLKKPLYWMRPNWYDATGLQV